MRWFWSQAAGWGERRQRWWGQWPHPGLCWSLLPDGGLPPPPPSLGGPSVTGGCGQEEVADGPAARVGAGEGPDSKQNIVYSM